MNSRSAGQCLSEAEVEDFLFNRLSGTTREVIEEHLLVCTKCQDLVEEEEGYVSAMRSAARSLESEQLEKAWNGVEEEKKGRAWFSGRVWGLALAGLAAVLVVGFFVARAPGSRSEVAIALTVERNAATAAEVKAGQALKIDLDLRGLPEARSYGVQVADQAGAEVERAEVGGDGVMRIGGGLSSGRYWVRVRSGSGELLREFALVVK